MSSHKYRKYPISHRLISFLRDKDIRGIRRLSVLLPKILLPNPEKVGEHIIQTIHDFKLKINPALDKGVELSLFETGTYEKGILSLLKDFLKPGDCFVDVGANIGLMSIFASKYIGSEGSVLAFEAHPETYKWLKFNIELNKISTIIPFDFALGSEKSKSFIYDNWQINRGGASLIIKDDDSKSYSIDVKKMDDCLTENRFPKVIKIDVEGFELEVLKGAKQTIINFKPILIIELSSLRTNQYEIEEMIQFIEKLEFYELFKLEGTKERVSKLVKITSRADLPEHDNIICISM